MTINTLAMKSEEEEVILQIRNFNPLVTNGLSHPYHSDESIFILGASGVFCVYSIFEENHVSKHNSPKCEAAFFGVSFDIPDVLACDSICIRM